MDALTKAIRDLINHETEGGAGDMVALHAFIDPGRGDVYITATCSHAGHSIIVTRGGQEVTRYPYGFTDENATRISYEPANIPEPTKNDRGELEIIDQYGQGWAVSQDLSYYPIGG